VSPVLLARPQERDAARPAVHAADRSLLDEVERAQRRGVGVEALIVRLAMPSHGARSHHRSVAYALLAEASLRRGGQVFAPRNGDLVLLAPDAGASGVLLTRLFGTACGAVEVLRSSEAILAYARERAADPLPPLAVPGAVSAGPAAASSLDAAEALLRAALPGDLVRCQVAAELLPGGGLRPLFREASARLVAFTARLSGAEGGWATTGPAQDLAAELDDRVLAIACDDLSRGGVISGGDGGLPLHLGLTVATSLSPEFERFAAAVAARGGRAGIGLSLAEACADLPGFERARDRIRARGLAVVLDGVGQQALLLTRPDRLGADLVKVEWSGALAAETAAADAIRAIGPDKVVLSRADDEGALRWGYALGVRRFQGRHMDAMLAASRLGRCASAAGCTPRLCAERASASGAAGRAGCRNTALLDAAA
jgi:hypothetical protein